MISLGRREGHQSRGLERDDWEEGGGWEKGASEPKLSEVNDAAGVPVWPWEGLRRQGERGG